MKINIGSNVERINGYVSVDLYAEADIKDDITTMATFEDNSVEEVRAYHLLEHLKDSDVSKAMSQIYRILQQGGKWIIEVPNLPGVLKQFLDTPEDDRWGFRLATLFGLQCDEGQFHKTGFSEERITKMLYKIGFSRVITRVYYSDGYQQEVIDVEAIK